MRRLLAPVVTALVISACAATTAGPPAVDNGELTNAADGARIAIKRGGELKVVLDANITTGYKWQSPTDPAPYLSAIGTPTYVGKSAEPRNLGAGGMNIFRFRADAPGRVTLQFDYSQPWVTGVPPAKTVRYDVVVQ